jgi:D-threo-aldose 1-dehydrogenase
LLTHNRFTLLDRSAEALIDQVTAAGMGVVNAAVYGGGILARGPGHTNKYAYRPASRVVLDRARAIERSCQTYGVPLRAAALQVSVRDPRISSTVVGTATPAHVDELVELATMKIPAALWEELSELVPPKTEWLDRPARLTG